VNQYQGTVTITVGSVPPPVTTSTAVNDAVSVGFGAVGYVISVLSNDSFGTDGPNLTHPLTLVNGKLSTASIQNGLISVVDNGTPLNLSDDLVSYSAPVGFSGTDTFTYTITDLNGDASTATVTITVAPVAPLTVPTAVADTFSVLEDSSNNDLAILANGDTFGADGATSITLGATSAGGTIVINENTTPGDLTDDTVTYTPLAGFVGVETFSYTLQDTTGDTATATVTITVGTVAPVVSTPTAVNDVASVLFGSTNNVINVLANDSFGSDGPINGGLTMTNGTLTSASDQDGLISIDNKGTLNTLDDVFIYSAPVGFLGVDTFRYTITDASGDASTATVTVTVNNAPKNDLGTNTFENTTVKNNEFLSYPNPSNGFVKTVLFSTISTKANILLFDITGKVIYNQITNISQGKNELEFNFNVKAGILFMKIASAEVNFGTTKIVFK
jgi:hypothetical protein